jgi:hypothetical protein
MAGQTYMLLTVSNRRVCICRTLSSASHLARIATAQLDKVRVPLALLTSLLAGHTKVKDGGQG